MTAVNEYAASEMRYWCRTNDFGGVGYSQPRRWSAYDNSNWEGWLTGPGEADCSAAVAGAYNIAFHQCGAKYPYFPRSTWTGSLAAEAASRGFSNIGSTWTGNVPDGGFRVGDLLLRTAGDSGHVAMAVRDSGDDSFDPYNPTIAELWIDSAGSIYGSAGGDGSSADDNGGESRLSKYSSHPLTQGAKWSTCLRYTGTGGSGSGGASDYQLSSIQAAVLRAADTVGCPWWAALACLQMETGEKGANIYGHDAGGAMSGAGEVTEENFRQFYALISNGHTSNGVGPLQITYPGYFLNDPDRHWWDPEKSSEVGCSILRDLIKSEGDSYEALRRVGSRYNSGNAQSAYQSYGVPFSNACRSWYNYGRPAGGVEGDELMASEAVNLLTEIRNALRYGKANDHPAGDVIWALDDIRLDQKKLRDDVVAMRADLSRLAAATPAPSPKPKAAASAPAAASEAAGTETA